MVPLGPYRLHHTHRPGRARGPPAYVRSRRYARTRRSHAPRPRKWQCHAIGRLPAAATAQRAAPRRPLLLLLLLLLPPAAALEWTAPSARATPRPPRPAPHESRCYSTKVQYRAVPYCTVRYPRVLSSRKTAPAPRRAARGAPPPTPLRAIVPAPVFARRAWSGDGGGLARLVRAAPSRVPYSIRARAVSSWYSIDDNGTVRYRTAQQRFRWGCHRQWPCQNTSRHWSCQACGREGQHPTTLHAALERGTGRCILRRRTFCPGTAV